jgi:glycosyltransferase involved in cell wall biosynthesis
MIWYRELYMKPLLEKIRKRGLYFLHNAIEPVYDTPGPAIKKDIDFLWLNRVIPERKYKWFMDIVQKTDFSHTQNFLVGIMPETIFSPDQDYVKNNKPANLVLEPYSNDPGSFFKRARFFVLPADVVFANHALLEAMAYGVVPLVSRQQGSELIVDDHVNGFIFQHTTEGMEAAMQEALRLTSQQYDAYSLSAARKIRDSFSEKKYSDSLSILYKMLE